MSDALIFDLMSNLPTAVYMYYLATVLPMRNVGAFVMIEGTASLLASSLRQGIAPVGSPLNAVFSLSGLLVIPMLFYDRRTPLIRRVAACVLGMLLSMFGDVASGLIVVLCGYEFRNYEQIAGAGIIYQLGIHAICMIFMLVACMPTRALFSRWMRDTLRADGTFAGNEGTLNAGDEGGREQALGTQHASTLFATIPVAQGVFIWVIAVLLCTASNQSEQLAFLLGICLLCALCLAADAVLFKTVQRYELAREQQAYAEALETHLREQTAAYEQLSRQVEDTARMRHDLRNHLQVLISLVNLGQTERAEQYTASMLSELEAVGEEGAR